MHGCFQMASHSLNVLFVDDDPVNRRLGARMLQRLGCTFVMLEDGDEVCMYVRMHVHAYVCMRVYLYVRMCMHVYVHVCVRSTLCAYGTGMFAYL